MRWLAMLIVSLVTACSGEPISGDVDGGLGDALPAYTELTLEFLTSNELPTTLDGDVEVEDIYLNGAIIRAIGDATTTDERATTRYDYGLHWDHDDQPRGLSFAAAPAGQYAYVQLRITGRPDGDPSEAFEIKGSARVNGDREDFTIRAKAPVVIANVQAALRLEASRPLTIKLELDIAKLMTGLVFDGLPLEDGKLRLDERSPAQLAVFTTALGTAFRLR
jgi:hypothetical protein